MQQGYWIRFALIYAFGILGMSTLGMAGPLVGDLAPVFGSSPSVVGIALGLQALVGALFGTFIGGLIDRSGTKPMLMAGAALVAAGDATAFFTTTFVAFGVALLLQSTGVAILLATGQASVTGLATGARQARGLAFWSTVGFIGFACGLLIGGFFGNTPVWRWAFASHAAFGVVLLLLSPLISTLKVSARRESILAVLKERKVVLLSISFVLVATTSMGMNAAISQYLHSVHKVPLSVAAGSAAFGNVLALLGSVIIGIVLGRGGNISRAAIVVTVVGIAMGSIAHLPTIPFAGAIVAFYIFQILASSIIAFIYATMPRVLDEPSRIGAATGMVVQSGAVAAMLGAPVFFAVNGTGSWLAITAVIAGCWLLAFLLMPLREIGERSQPASREAFAGH